MASSDNQNIWFGISMGLMGLIVGFVFATFSGGGFQTGADAPPSAPNAPTAPDAPQGPEVPETAKDVEPVDAKTDHIRGSTSAKLAFIEYSDLECPYCGAIHPTVKQILDEYGNEVMWVYRHFPLSFHPNALRAAESSECAAELGGNDAFWKYVDAIFEGQKGGLSDTLYASAAKAAGLNAAKFKACLDSGKHKAKVQAQQKAGELSGIQGTPGNILLNIETGDTRLVSGARPFGDFKKNIDEMLAQ